MAEPFESCVEECSTVIVAWLLRKWSSGKIEYIFKRKRSRKREKLLLSWERREAKAVTKTVNACSVKVSGLLTLFSMGVANSAGGV